MSANSLESITIYALRGSTCTFSLKFEKGKKLTIIYGENGTGKTTICDAFEFIGNRNVGSLEKRGLGNTTRFWHSVDKDQSDVSVILKCSDMECTAFLQRDKVFVTPSDVRTRVEVLRRSQIHSLIEAQAAQRYEVIRRFIDVEEIENSERSLRTLYNSLLDSSNTAIAGIEANREDISSFWETAGKPGLDPIIWAENELAQRGDEHGEEINAIKILQDEYRRISDLVPQYLLCAQEMQTAIVIASGAASKMDEILQSVAGNADELVGILESAKKFLDKNSKLTRCPLCESSEYVAGLNQRVTERIEEFSVLLEAKKQLSESTSASQNLERRLEEYRIALSNQIIRFNDALKAYSWSSDFPLTATLSPSCMDGIAEWLLSTNFIKEKWSVIESKLRYNQRFIDTLRSTLGKYNRNYKSLRELEALLPQIERALAVIVDERRKFTDDILADIVSEVGRLYEKVHPGEGLEKVRLELDPQKRASLEMYGNFNGKGETPPQAYFSQSHIDTLGLCIFLALAAKEEPEDTILILDDVLSSVDEPHIERLVNMIYDEVEKFRHCIVTTHYRTWKEKIKWKMVKSDKCQLVELTRWTFHGGISLTNSLPEIDRLRKLLEETTPDPRAISSLAGVVLESALNFLTYLYECRVPRRKNERYTLGDLFPAIEKKLRQSLKVEILMGKVDGELEYRTEYLYEHIEKLDSMTSVRNEMGSHYSEESFQLPENDAIDYGKHVLSLIEMLMDEAVGWPKNDKSGSYWATPGETRRLHPLKRPS